MLFENCREGMDVVINSCSQTNEKFGANKSMKEMVGRMYRIKRIYPLHKAIEINGWTWHPKDISELNEMKKDIPKPETFDPKDLNI